MTLYVGIDVSKFKHDLAILEDQGEIITKTYALITPLRVFKF